MAFNADELVAPPWMDVAFLTKVLHSGENNKFLKITDHVLTPGSAAGDHFASIMFRAKITYSSKTAEGLTVSYIIKTMPFEEGLKKDFLADGAVFKRESQMYTSFIGDMQRLLKQAGDNVELGPRLIYSGTTPTFVLVFEDLIEKGYIVKPTLLNLEETKLIISKIAKWHATSYYMGKQKSPITELKSILFEQNNPELIKMFGGSFQNLKKAVEKWPDHNEQVIEKLEKLTTEWFQSAAAIFSPEQQGDYCVLNHSDFHFKNAMYKYQDDKLEDILLIDFQMCTWGSPAIDLIYSLYAMASKETRENHKDELIVYYHNLFSETLKSVGYMGPIPTLLALHVELLKCGFVEVMIACCFLPFFYIDFSKPDPDMDMTKLMDPSSGMDFFNSVFGLPAYKEDMQKLLPRFLHKGFMDC